MKRRIIIAIGAIVVLTLALWYYTKQTQGPASEKVLVTVSPAHIKGLDPIQSDDAYSAQEIAKVYEGLVEYHYLKRPYELVPQPGSSHAYDISRSAGVYLQAERRRTVP